MRAPTALQGPARLLACAGILASAPREARAGETVEGVTAVFSRVSSDYVRVKQADGSYQPETFSFGNGGHWDGGLSDSTIDKLQFMDVAQMVAGPLAAQHYVPSRDPKSAKLVILVYWGSTPARSSDSMATQNLQTAAGNLAAVKSSNAQQKNAIRGAASKGGGPGAVAQNSSMAAAITSAEVMADADNAMTGAMAMAAAETRSRDQLNNKVAALLGYDALWNDSVRFEGTPLDYRRHDLSNELEEGRYFVVLMAYDFQLLWTQKRHKLLWETRFSISERRNAFNEALPAMAQYASEYFGRDSHGLLRKDIPLGRVDVGEVKSLGEAEAPQK